MRRNTMSMLCVPAIAGLIVLAGCSGGDDPATLGPVPTAPSTTTTEPAPTTTTTTSTTTTTVAGVTTTTARAPSTTTTRPPVNGMPQVTATPARAAVGARVRIEGAGFTDDMWKVRDAPLWLSGAGSRSGCNLFAETEHTVTVSAAGRLTGEFVVPYVGNCRMSESDGAVPVGAGTYRIVFPCTACSIGEIEVTAGAVQCGDIGFTPNSDDVAGGIIAAGMTCAEAQALVRTVGAQVGAVGGPSRVESGGFVCVRTSQDDGARGLPSSTFECTSGSKRVTFSRT